MNREGNNMNCREVEPLLMLLAWDELEGAERASVEEHLTACDACRLALERERRLPAVVGAAQPAEPDPFLLANCRNELNDALDLAAERKSAWRRWMTALRPSNWFVLHPAWGAALCLVIGIALGNAVPQWISRTPQEATGGQTLDIVRPTPIGNSGFQNVSITGIDLLPASGTGAPEVVMYTEEPQELRGTLGDAKIRGLLAYVVQNGQRFDSGLRLDSIELLKTQSNDAEVRQALCYAARQDANPGVRLKALEALRDVGDDETVRQILIDALLHDENPGVRIEAINALRAFAESAGPERAAEYPHLIKVLQDRMQRDPNTYVRLQSAAAIRQLGPRATY